ncbi:MAG: DUF6067 family protein [Kiritimatiellae bacterium]|nr:DUF6067 family protein [Kiritimatiellia bacterium]
MRSMMLALVLSVIGLAVAADPNNLPSTVGERAALAERVLERMERAAAPETIAAFKAAQPSSFWLFGEGRQWAVRNNIVPAHWFDNNQAHARFEGEACPGEFYVFQACVLSDIARELTWEIRAEIGGTELKDSVCVTPAVCRVGAGGLKPLWAGIHVPRNADGKIVTGKVMVRDRQGGEPRVLVFRVAVHGVPLERSGLDDAWRLARLQWLDSTVGGSESEVTRPFTPIEVNKSKKAYSVLGREVQLTEQGLPAQIISRFSASNTRSDAPGRELLAGESALRCVVGGVTQLWTKTEFTNTAQTPVYAAWSAASESGNIRLSVNGRLEYDGYLSLRMSLAAIKGTTAIDRVSFDLPVIADVARYAMGLGRQGGFFPEHYAWVWDVRKQQDALWFGDVNAGMLMRLKGGNYERPLINVYYAYKPLRLPDSWGGGGVELSRTTAGAAVSAYSGAQVLTGKPLVYGIDFYLTPFKPIDVRTHLSDRYYHASIHNPPEKKLAEIKVAGANIVNLHHKTVQNPYINYPYNEDGVGYLKRAVDAAHEQDLRLNVYYTTRELTQNLPEFFALKSLDGEILISSNPEVDKSTVINPKGAHPWLRQHVGMDVIPAWKETISFKEYPERLDLSVLTTPDSRWNNFYLAGLEYLIQKVGIDGVYIDDTALDRLSMQRARRILDADGNAGRRIDMHSWNHFNEMAGFASSSVLFMELYPYYDRLWHGESFNYDTPPEYWLTEISGIPFGLMGEMLQNGGNPWRGMVFGMTQRWPWSGDPRALWSFFDQVGLADADYLGWWDPSCPVKSGDPALLVSVYRLKGAAVIAVANFSAQDKPCGLRIDWNALGMEPVKSLLRAPAIKGFQAEHAFEADQVFDVPAKKGWLIVVTALN